MYKVKDYKDLERDPITNAIINTNSLEHKKYVTGRSAKDEKNRKLQSLENEVAILKEDLSEIKNLLIQLTKNEPR